MSDLQITRACRITIWQQTGVGFVGQNPAFFEELGNGIEIEPPFRVQFKVEKHLGSDPNTAEVVITNLSEHTRTAFNRRPLRVRIEAGHNDTSRLLFVGDVRPGSRSTLEGTDWETKLLLGDGSRAFAGARVSRTYKPGVPIRNIIRDAAAAMDLKLPDNLEIDSQLSTHSATGEGLSGHASDELTRLLAPYGYTWSFQSGVLRALRYEDVVHEDNAWLIDKEVLVGSPEPGVPDKSGKPPLTKFKTTLYPELQPGDKVELRSRGVSGLHRLENVSHEGDTRGDPWHTECEARPL